LQPRENRIRIGARDFCVIGIRESRIQQAAILGATIMHRAPEVVAVPVANAGLFVRRQVGCVNVAERRRYGATAGIGIAAARGVAAHAIADACQVFSAGDLLFGIGRWR
jgi:hypothetical protein